MAKETPKGFVLFYDYRQHLSLLSDEERGQLLMALFDYGESGTEPELTGMALMAFSFIRSQMDKDRDKYIETCQKRSRAGKQGGRPPKTSENTDETPESKENHEDSDENNGKQKKQMVFDESNEKQNNPNTNTNKKTKTNTNTNTNVFVPNTESPPISPSGGTQSDVQESRFEEFWEQYPKKVGKKAALGSWKKVKPNAELFARIMQAVTAAKKSEEWTREGGRFIPNPSTWLNQGRWDDELTPTVVYNQQEGGQNRGQYSRPADQPETRASQATPPTLSGFRMAGE